MHRIREPFHYRRVNELSYIIQAAQIAKQKSKKERNPVQFQAGYSSSVLHVRKRPR
jgi:hypothetical protein